MKPKMYIYALNALKNILTPEGLPATQSAFTSGICSAYSEEEAYGRAMKHCKTKFPQCEGYTTHAVVVTEVSQEVKNFIKELDL